ncbi:MAG: hypothetical protein C0424_10975 [Sphingobacteriaceae bacterium]|nr:hypothetical protein [Sphingobacteriaceae bacterium]
MKISIWSFLGLFLALSACNNRTKTYSRNSNDVLIELKSKLGVAANYNHTWLDSASRLLKQLPIEQLPLDQLSEAHRDLGWRYCDLKAFGPATLHFLEAYEYAKDANNALHQTEACLALGWMFHRFQDHGRAATYYKKALELSYLTEDQNYTARSYHELAKTSLYAKQYDKALEYARFGLQLKNVSEPAWKVQLQNDIGLVYLRLKKYQEAMASFQTAIEFAKDNPYSTGYVYGNVGAIFLEQGKPKQAVAYLQKDFNISMQLADFPSAASAAIDLSSAMLLQNDRKEALHYLKIADSLFVLDPEKNFIDNNYENWKELLKDLEGTNERLFMTELLVQTLNNRLKIEVDESNNQLVTIAQMVEFSNQLKQSELKTLKANRLKLGYIYTAVSLLLLLSGGAIYFISRNHILKQKYKIDELRLARREQELKILEQQKNLQAVDLQLQKEHAENQALRMEQMQQIQAHTQLTKGYVEDITLQLAESIRIAIQTENKLSPNVKSKLEGSLRMYDHSLQTQSDMNLSGSEDANQFIRRLKDKFPDLSADEIKLCSYLRLQMSTKEIASIKMITIAGVNKSRNRIRKKLGLTPSQDLSEFLIYHI